MAANTDIATDIITFDILTQGIKTNTLCSLKSIVVNKEANKIAYAQLILFDSGEIKDGFTISDTDDFIPGNTIEIKAGYHFKNTTVFKGIIIKHGIRRTTSRFEIIIDCKHPAVTMTVCQKSNYFYNAKDSDIAAKLVNPYGIALQATPTKVTHKAMVQHRVSDWEFMLMRAEANGLLVHTDDDALKIIAPETSNNPVLNLDPGSIMEIESEMDALTQLKAVSAAAWDSAAQKVIKTEAVSPKFSEQGNIDAGVLAGVTKHTTYEMPHTGNLDDTELQARADAKLLKSRLAKIRGRIKCQGNADIRTGDTVRIDGIGKRFNGPVYITGVRHQINSKNWETDLQFGLAPESYGASTVREQNHNLVPPISGLQIGVVVQLQDDPLGEDRILVRAPMVSENEPGIWARINCLDAGKNRGTFFRPEIGDEVVLGFIDNDPRYPMVLGMLNSSARPAPLKASDKNPEKGFVTKEALKLLFNDETKGIAMETPNGNLIIMSDEDGGISLKDENGNSVLMNADGITLESSKDLILKAQGDITMEGMNTEIKAGAELKAEGSAGAEISAGGNTVIKGAMVMIN